MSGEEDLMRQVEDSKKKIREAEEEKQVAEEEKEEMRRRREEVRERGYMMRGSGAGGLASRAMGSAMHVEQQGTEDNDSQFYFPSGHLNTVHQNFRRIPPRYQHSGIG